VEPGGSILSSLLHPGIAASVKINPRQDPAGAVHTPTHTHTHTYKSA